VFEEKVVIHTGRLVILFMNYQSTIEVIINKHEN